MSDAIDMYQANEVEVVIASHEDGWRLWVNIDGQNRLRIYRIKHLVWRNHDEWGRVHE